MNNLPQLGERIREKRKELKLRQSDLAKKIGVSTSNVTKYETGVIVPSVETLFKIEKALNLNNGELLTSRQIENHVLNLLRESPEQDNIFASFLKQVNYEKFNNKYDLNKMLSDEDFLQDIENVLTVMAKVLIEKY